jgi:type 2 lantibiotic biosynthesis protein LanM
MLKSNPNWLGGHAAPGRYGVMTSYHDSTEYWTPWHHALTLPERVELYRTRISPRSGPAVRVAADERVQRWRDHARLSSDATFALRLETDGLSAREFQDVLCEPIDQLCSVLRSYPAWLLEFDEAFSQITYEATATPLAPSSHPLAGFLGAIEPLIQRGRSRLEQGLRELSVPGSGLPFNTGTIRDLLCGLWRMPLLQMVSRTMALELHVAGLRGMLQGDTPEDRFNHFLQCVRDRETALRIFQEYPVLARQVQRSIDFGVTRGLEFIQRLIVDWELIRNTFCPRNSDDVLVEVKGVGDTHRQGRSVLVARFRSGFQVVYKPRPLALDLHFQELLTWLNGRGEHPPFRTLAVLDRGSYGWVEFVCAEDCTSAEQVERFYERQGGYLALLHALKATDFHCENLVAAGEHPVLIDVEALFHPDVVQPDDVRPGAGAWKALNRSVLRVGLLPQRIWARNGSDGVDISGLGAPAGQLTFQNVPQWDAAGTDAIRMTRKPLLRPGTHHRPTLNERNVDVLAHSDSLIKGFTRVYQLLIEHRDALLSETGPLAGFASDEVRVILRGTRTYARLLAESFHPDVLRDALDRDRLFDRLWAPVQHLPDLARVIPAERADLYNGDIPLFTARPSSRDLWSSSGERITGYLAEPPLRLIERHVQDLRDDDLAKQLWLVRASLATLSQESAQGYQRRRPRLAPHRRVDRGRLFAAAETVGRRLHTLAVEPDGGVSWIGLTFTNERAWSLAPLGPELYDGVSGVALFLAHLGATLNDDRYTVLAQRAVNTLRRDVDTWSAPAIGAFSGMGGVVYALTHLAALWSEPALLREAESLVARADARIADDEDLDVVAGAAGLILALRSLHRCRPSESTLAVMTRCGNRLLDRAIATEHGCGWNSRHTGAAPLTGFSHGAAGIAWSLLELSALTGDERFARIARQGLAYERSLFRAEVGNWPDLRPSDGANEQVSGAGVRCMTAWCHGAPGIGLGRLRALEHVDDAVTRAEIETALATTCRSGFGLNHSLCHGDLGNLELLLQASVVPGFEQWREHLDRFVAQTLDDIDRHGWACANPSRIDSPGLMTGLAGIGYALLRLADPARIPSVLTLAPPGGEED